MKNVKVAELNISTATVSLNIIVWFLRDFHVIRIITSKCLIDSFSLHNRVEKKYRCQKLFCILVT